MTDQPVPALPENDTKPVIDVKGLNYFFGEGEARKQALFDNELSVSRGEIVIMTGPSGSGKTTLLTLMGTLRKVTDGSLKVMGQELRGMSEPDIVALRKKIGFIFQAHNLFESLTAFQNVRMASELVGMKDEESGPKIEALLTRLGLGHRIHYKPKKLSGGQKQRVAIARGLVHRPQLILADEPTAALDKESGREAVTMLQEMAKEGSTIVMVTHDNRILDVADRIVRMVDGQIVYNVFVQEAEIICEFLHNIPMFSDFSPTTLTMVAESMTPIRYSPGATIIRQGDEGDQFYVIRDGEVEVSVASNGAEKVVKELQQGDYFGEVALMTNDKRNATVRAKGVTTCYTLSKDKFRETMDNSQSFQEELRNALAHRR